MSDEEIKAIEYLRKHILPYYGGKGTIEFMLNDVLLNLIEKQSKEIEELKEKNKTLKNLQNDTNRLYTEMIERKNYFERELQKLEDKIKAKIKELNDGIKRDMINYDKVKDESWKLAIHRSMAQKIEIKKVLQSLLEKE